MCTVLAFMNLSACPRKSFNFLTASISTGEKRVRVMEINKDKLSVQIVYTPPNSMLEFLKLEINIMCPFENSESNHINARICGRRRHICLELAEGQVSRWAFTWSAKPVLFLPVSGISVLPQASLRSPTAHVDLLQLSFTHKTFPNQLKTIYACITIPDTIINISKLRREEMVLSSFSADVSFSSSET